MSRQSEDGMLRCPFCEAPLEEPHNIKGRFGSEFTGGKCACGAVFVFDRSGRNMGEAYVDALAYACDDDWDKAWSLTPDEDYEIREMGFDRRRQRFSSSQKRITPSFLFIRINK